MAQRRAAMADAFAFPLLVELEENNAPRLKNKLIKYFQSKKSNGGDCEVDYENGSRTAALRFRTEEDRQNVLGKKAHQIALDKGVLKLTVRLPPDEGTAQEAPSDTPIKNSDVAVHNTQSSANEPTPEAEVEAEAKGRGDSAAGAELCSTAAVLENVPEMLNQEFLEMLVENVLKDPDSESASKRFTLEVLPDISSAVVTFHSGKENTDFVTRCPQNRMFINKGLKVRPLEVTAQVAVEDVQNIGQDLLDLYFANEGGEVEDVTLNEVEQSAVITFKHHKAVPKIMKKKHCIRQKEIRVYPFYKSLGTALYGKDKRSLKLPAAISEPIDSAVWRYLNDNQSAAQTIHSDLAQHFCNVNLKQSTVFLTPVSSLLQQKDAKAIVKDWRNTVKSAFAQAVSKFKYLTFHPQSEVWQESEESFRRMLQNEDVVVVPDKASGVLSVVGLVDNVNRLEQTLRDVINKIVKKADREKSSITQVIKVSSCIFHILCEDGLQDKLLSVYPDLKMSIMKDGLTVTGLNQEIMAASSVIYDMMLSLKHRNLEMDNFLLDLLKEEEQEELTNTLLTSNGINAAFKISADRVQLLAVSERELNNAEDHLESLLMSKYIAIEDSNLLEKPEWEHLVSQLENANSKSCSRLRIQTTRQQVVVSGHKESVVKVSSKLNDFLMQNAQVEETVEIKPNIIVDYVKKCNASNLEQMKDHVVVSYKKEAICLSGPRVDVGDCRAMVEKLVSSVFFESVKVSKPGVKKFFQDKETMYFSTLWNETGCLVQLVDGRLVGLAQKQVANPVYQLQTSDGVEIAVCKANMCSYAVHAVVNASSCDLKHNSGLARALSKAAGPQFQVDCDKIILLEGQLKPGDSVITDARGQLCCKKVIHAVGPKFDSAKLQKVQAQLKRAVKGSLELAEKHHCISVALPTISRSQGFPADLCAVIITKAVKEHCDERCDDSTLKKIHFVDNDDTAVKAMEAAVRQEFGNNGVSLPQQILHTKATTSPPVGHAASDPNCLGQVKTKEGLDITLTKGKIEYASTEVTVNTVFEDLLLNKGAVSNAIFNVAGPKLQQLVNAKNAQGTAGEIIVTDGCKLKSKQVFHAVAPQWDNGKGIAEKTLSAIFKDCLDKAENAGLSSISFPAIGTGNLGFPKDLVASLMLNEISAFSSKKQLQHLKKVVIILYSGDAPTIQVFSNEFNKQFPSASAAPVSTSSPQSPRPFSKVVSSSGMHETRMGSVAIQVVTGDITKETTDVIVNSSNENFSLKSGVSKAILDAAGQPVEEECQDACVQPSPSMIMTQPGNLKCKKILHLVGQSDPVKIKKVVEDALQMCVKNSYTSVSFPAIGTGQGNVQAKQVADAMLDAVVDVLSQYTSGPLNTVRIIIFQQPMLKDFYDSLHEREVTHPGDKSSFWGNIGTKLKSLFGSESTSKPQTQRDFVTDALKVDPVFFHICGDSQAQVGSAKQWINDLIAKEQTSITIQDNAILTFSAEDFKCVVDIQKTRGVSIKTESKQAQASFTIEGLGNDVLKATSEIHDLLKKVRAEEELKNKVAQASEKADWQYQCQQQGLQSFDSLNNFQLEQAWEKNLKQVNIKLQGQDYTVTLPTGPATDSQGRTLQIKRVDKLKDEDIPDHWDTMPANTSCQAIAINPGTPEHTEVLTLFQASCNRTVIKIERIQNPVLWKSLQIKKRDMEVRNGHQNNEKRLFHGTCHTTVAYISEHGFNRSYAGKNAACYGNGTYFAVNASYSAGDTYSKPNPNGEKCMYLCRVLTGDFTVGTRGMVVPPSKGTVSVQMYDSVVDNITKPTMFIIFHDSQACPEYLITFK